MQNASGFLTDGPKRETVRGFWLKRETVRGFGLKRETVRGFGPRNAKRYEVLGRNAECLGFLDRENELQRTAFFLGFLARQGHFWTNGSSLRKIRLNPLKPEARFSKLEKFLMLSPLFRISKPYSLSCFDRSATKGRRKWPFTVIREWREWSPFGAKFLAERHPGKV